MDKYFKYIILKFIEILLQYLIRHILEDRMGEPKEHKEWYGIAMQFSALEGYTKETIRQNEKEEIEERK